MKRKTSLAVLILLIVSASGFYVFAQNPADRQQAQAAKAAQDIEKRQEEKQRMVRRMLLFENDTPIKGLLLLHSNRRRDGTAELLACPIPIPSTTLAKKQKVRIEMLDGSAQEIDLKLIKKMTVE